MGMNKIEEAITGYWGERCPDHEPECPTCQAWDELDKLTTERNHMERMLRKLRTILMQAGYYDDALAINMLLFPDESKD